MKKCFLLFILLNLFATNAQAMATNGLALVSVGLMSTSLFCAIEAAGSQTESWDTRDPYQRRALIVSRNNWLKGALLTGLPGAALLAKVAAGNPRGKLLMGSAFGSSILFAISGAYLRQAKRCEEEFNITGEQHLLDMGERLKQFAGAAALAGMIFCVPIAVS